ncbi:XdhC family protein [Gordonia polyisoprenivorans]|uniref:XdhC family protein n=1 Tax=Gordonia polyisoprenivorans TaxID=84595 RepID=UPI001AD6742D|nr:XdhC/CoxI family protein [Gordonia polyisoprenivorans]QTI68454.1 XdhC family protein [Gordonia polyisoprenivorans]
MRDVLPALVRHLERGPVALARVISTTGASPRDVGSAMLITDDGEIIGSLSGGCVESAIIDSAAQALSDETATIEHFGLADPDGIAIGLTCGGEMEVLVERLGAGHLGAVRRLAAAVAAGTPIAVAATLGASPTWHVVTPEDQRPWRHLDADIADLLATGRSGIIGVDDCETGPQGDRPRTFVQTFAPRSRLILVGANDFVRALATLGSTLGYHVTVVDARAVFATRARFPDADEVIVDWPHRYLAREIAEHRTDRSTCVCVMTHDAKFDVPVLRTALGCDRVGFIGALGSRRTVADRNARLVEAGVTADRLARLRSPLGLDLGAHTPAEVAVSIAAQLIADRHDASGMSLTLRSGPIHR